MSLTAESLTAAAELRQKASLRQVSPLIRDQSVAAVLAVLAAARQAQGISQRDLAARLGVTEDLVGRWECGCRMPRLANLVAWASALGGVVAVLAPPLAEGGSKPATCPTPGFGADFSTARFGR